MKYQHLVFVFTLLITASITSSCKKDQVPGIVDPNCIDTVFFTTQIAPMIANNCLGCHNVVNSTGYTLTNHTNISANASAILAAMQGSPQLMPIGGPALNDTLIQQFACWINQGTLNN